MYKPTRDELNETLRLHTLWARGHEGGVKANLEGFDLSGANLRDRDLYDINLKGANLAFANLEKTNLCDANLKNTNLQYAILRRAYLIGANCYQACLQKANLEGSDLRDAKLRYANLNGANLSWTNLNGADLTGANLESTDLYEADLGWVTGNEQEILTILTSDAKVNITGDKIWINDNSHCWEKWLNFTDDEIWSMYLPLEWWRQWQPKLAQIIKERTIQKTLEAKHLVLKHTCQQTSGRR